MPVIRTPTWQATYTGPGQLTSLDLDVDQLGTREFNWLYDEFGRATSQGIESNAEWGVGVSRDFSFGYDDGTGVYTRTGPDGVTTTLTVDSAYRVSTVEMSNGLRPGLGQEGQMRLRRARSSRMPACRAGRRVKTSLLPPLCLDNVCVICVSGVGH